LSVTALAEAPFKERALQTRARLSAARDRALSAVHPATMVDAHAQAGLGLTGGAGVGLARKVTNGRVENALVLHLDHAGGLGAYAGIAVRQYKPIEKSESKRLTQTIPASEYSPWDEGGTAAVGLGVEQESMVLGFKRRDEFPFVKSKSVGAGVGGGFTMEENRRNFVIPLPGGWRSKALRRSERGLKLVDRAEAAHEAGKTEKAERLLNQAGAQE
jgi:hypothetical protein